MKKNKKIYISEHSEAVLAIDPVNAQLLGTWVTPSVSATQPYSMMRRMSLLSLIIGGAIAFLGMYRYEDLGSLAALASVFVVPAFAGKAVQKHIETRK